MWQTVNIEMLAAFTTRCISMLTVYCTTFFPLLIYVFRFNSIDTFIPITFYNSKYIKNKNLEGKYSTPFFLPLLGLGGERN